MLMAFCMNSPEAGWEASWKARGLEIFFSALGSGVRLQEETLGIISALGEL